MRNRCDSKEELRICLEVILFNSIQPRERTRLFHFFNKDHVWNLKIGFMKKVDFTECAGEDSTDIHLNFVSLQMRD
jgi:hypothetical protein